MEADAGGLHLSGERVVFLFGVVDVGEQRLHLALRDLGQSKAADDFRRGINGRRRPQGSGLVAVSHIVFAQRHEVFSNHLILRG